MTGHKTIDQLTSDDLDQLHEQIDQTRNAAMLHRQGLITTAELYAVIEATAEPGPAATEPTWTPPPPGDQREQLPDHILALIDIPSYTSTACETAALLDEAATVHPEHAEELQLWEQRQRQRCRINNKYTGALCQHVAEPDATARLQRLSPWREKIAAAIQAVQDGHAAPVEVGDERIVDAVMAVRDREMEQLRAVSNTPK